MQEACPCSHRIVLCLEPGWEETAPRQLFQVVKRPCFSYHKRSWAKKAWVEQWKRWLNSHWNSQELFPWCWWELDPDLKQLGKMIRAAWPCILQLPGAGHSPTVPSSYSPGQNPSWKMRSSVCRTLTWTQLCLFSCPNMPLARHPWESRDADAEACDPRPDLQGKGKWQAVVIPTTLAYECMRGLLSQRKGSRSWSKMATAATQQQFKHRPDITKITKWTVRRLGRKQAPREGEGKGRQFSNTGDQPFQAAEMNSAARTTPFPSAPVVSDWAQLMSSQGRRIWEALFSKVPSMGVRTQLGLGQGSHEWRPADLVHLHLLDKPTSLFSLSAGFVPMLADGGSPGIEELLEELCVCFPQWRAERCWKAFLMLAHMGEFLGYVMGCKQCRRSPSISGEESVGSRSWILPGYANPT